jgi:tRNA-2-methylthio-N6-dimethylallyladenosine synthase
MKKRLYIETYGCQMNVYDSRVIVDKLQQAGFSRVERPELADVMLLNTCAVRDNAEQRVMGRIGELMRHKKEREGVLMGVVGCMAQRLGQKLHAQRKAVDLIVGTDQYERLAEIIERARREGSPQFDLTQNDVSTYQASPEHDPENNTHFISITRGCDYRCTFCVVPTTRGPLRPKDPATVVAEAESVVREQGGVEVTLLGQNVTAYRHPEASFGELLRRVNQVEGLRRIRFLTNHPTDFTEETLAAIAESEKVSPWLHMPIQSGSDRILRRMKRGYRRAEYLELVRRCHQQLDDVTFSTDIIVGFPGETDEDFQQTLSLMREMRYDSAFTFKYSPRPGTPASRLEDDVPTEVKNTRIYRLNALQEELWERKARSLVGSCWEIAIEGPDRKGRGYLRGRTLNNRKVLVPARDDLGRGDELLVRVTGSQATTFFAETLGLLWKYDRVAA